MSGVDITDLKERLGICVFTQEPWYFDDENCRKTLKEQFKTEDLGTLGLSEYDCGLIAAGALFLYLRETQKSRLSQMTNIIPYTVAVNHTSTRVGSTAIAMDVASPAIQSEFLTNIYYKLAETVTNTGSTPVTVSSAKATANLTFSFSANNNSSVVRGDDTLFEYSGYDVVNYWTRQGNASACSV